MGAKVRVVLERYGFYPAGGGRIVVEISPVSKLKELELIDRGDVTGIYGRALVSNLPVSIAEREIKVVREKLKVEPENLRAEKVSNSKASILITGESGTGKELFAHLIHDRSLRQTKPFVSISCGALPASILERELFGHEKGAFTGADSQKIGLFEAADGVC